jgi:acyl-CoA synthetase (AMP-forming)/AMP-acid ligase II
MLTHRNILNNGFYIGECQHFGENERVCLPVPLFHCFAACWVSWPRSAMAAPWCCLKA